MGVQKHAQNAKANFLLAVKENFLQRIQADRRDIAGQFAEVFAEHLYLEDWQSWEVADLAGCIHCLWVAAQKSPKDVYLRAFNPNLEEDGWLCSGTAFIVHQKDMPFLVDSLRLELTRQELPVHLIKSTLLLVARDQEEQVVAVRSFADEEDRSISEHWSREVVIYLETGRVGDEQTRGDIASGLKRVLDDVHLVVDDHKKMLAAVDDLRCSYDQIDVKSNDKQADFDISEGQAFLAWLVSSHFTFFGAKDYTLVKKGKRSVLLENKEARLGIFKRLTSKTGETTAEVAENYVDTCSALISFSKSSRRSNVHRNVYPDYVVVKRLDQNGNMVGETRFCGLFTYSVHNISPFDIPIVRQKVQAVMARTKLSELSHDGKNLLRIVEGFPRNELFQSSVDELSPWVVGVARINERRMVKLFTRVDPFAKFVYCLVYVPRDIYSTLIRKKIESLVSGIIDASEVESTTYFSESQLARAYMVFKLSGEQSLDEIDHRMLERAVVDVTRGWPDRFEAALIDAFGESQGLQFLRLYSGAFSNSYQENFDARSAVKDIELVEGLSGNNDIAMQLLHPLGAEDGSMRFKLMQLNKSVELSDVIPILERLGLRVLGEHPYRIKRSDEVTAWIHDFTLSLGMSTTIDVHSVKKLFEQAFEAIWHGKTENDGFNRLVLSARLSWREVNMLRAYSAYMKQTDFTFTADYIADTLFKQPEITRNLVALFKSYFEPRLGSSSKSDQRSERIKEKILQSLEAIENLGEDRVLRRYLDLMLATLRTNFYQKCEQGEFKEYVSFKLSPRDIADLPEPRPRFEIFIYSPRVEGVHLRAASVARGGLRWSDRLQDYRTEVLGLVKAQQVKNAVIVPSGAKGGFVAKRDLSNLSRDDFYAEGVACYQIFIQGLLDLTDNYVSGELISPDQVICRDEADPYLVVAADKGTATFSDIANKISLKYNHWLGDAFASGGSNGYDHKKMGITARGAWVSVRRHFREKGVNIQEQEFTVVGIGDMSGDVFGNGMLLSEKICLVAAFNHQHIFIDPTPDAAKSFAERKRLFELPRSTWADYDETLISNGGGIYSRSSKSITLSAQAQKALGVEHGKWSPNDLISACLQAPVDLLWNGGIGTYVKASDETHGEVGDKSNDAVRVNGNQLRCKVIGEGGNLGVTQLGRVEYSLAGGACNTDFIDNAAGVDCSDHEVNIKILLDELIVKGDLTEKQRNQLLAKMTGEVADKVLYNNELQTFALSLAQFQSKARLGENRRFIQFLEKSGSLNRQLEFLPSDEDIDERVQKGHSLTRPELSILLSYSKVMLKDAFITGNIADVNYLRKGVERAFPNTLIKKYKKEIYQHRLIKEIVATQAANEFVNDLGIAAAQRLLSSTGKTLREIVLAYAVVRDVFRIPQLQKYIESLNNKVPAELQAEIMVNMGRRLRRGTRWFLATRGGDLNPEVDVKNFSEGIREVNVSAKDYLRGDAKATWDIKHQRLSERGLEEDWVLQLAMPENLFSGLSVVEVSLTKQCRVQLAAEIFYHLYDSLELEWFATEISDVSVASYWQALARENFLDELEVQLRNLVAAVIDIDTCDEAQQKLASWHTINEQKISRWKSFVDEVRGSKSSDFAMFSVAISELVGLSKNAIEDTQ